MISSDWLYRWKCFISKNPSSNSDHKKSIRVSENERIGILPPGPIGNEDLRSNDELKEGLTLNKDYRVVNPQVWNIFYRTYGGGPPIIREDYNIYSRDVSKEWE